MRENAPLICSLRRAFNAFPVLDGVSRDDDDRSKDQVFPLRIFDLLPYQIK